MTTDRWQPLALQEGWRPVGDPFQPPAYHCDRYGWLHIRGVVTGGVPGTVIAILPPGIRPADDDPILIGYDGRRSPRITADGAIHAPPDDQPAITLDRNLDVAPPPVPNRA